ncbi:hypothetical protein GCM10011499_08340 [Pelagibacterium lentulum]|uniref:Uncharacterized protein n=1 Tax=Pelagibacterium lentulum TaxID=2029865 RepID=A0A916R6G6_9HYPH|nr:hypothetical protein GCM10011499_08340 [Pelagibacterium lentulum]
MANPDRKQILAAKLRENLRRRKSQAKARAQTNEGDAPQISDPNDKKDTPAIDRPAPDKSD